MNYTQVISIVAYVLCVVIFAVALYFKVRGNVVGSVSELIAMAEETDLLGPEKMALVVEKLAEKVPAAFKPFLSQERLEMIAQWIFDWMRKYALAYIHSHQDDPEHPHVEEISETNDALAEDMINKLSAIGSEALRELAAKIGIDVEGKSDSDIIKAVVFACLMKK